MISNFRSILLFAATPALVCGALLMNIAGVGSGLIVQQLLTFLGAVVLLWFVVPRRRSPKVDLIIRWGVVVLAACLFLPLAAGQGVGPKRWLPVGPLRLYIAPIVIPVLVLYLGALLQWTRKPLIWPLIVVLAVVLALLLQPDAAQLSAFACASVPVLLASSYLLAVRIIAIIALSVCVLFSWQIPDPLQPVAYVEGVLHLAAQISPLALRGAALAVFLPSVVLLWFAWTKRSVGFLAVAIYYIAIICLAPLQVTPVPLVGFGAGPLIGYVLMALAAAHAYEAAAIVPISAPAPS